MPTHHRPVFIFDMQCHCATPGNLLGSSLGSLKGFLCGSGWLQSSNIDCSGSIMIVAVAHEKWQWSLNDGWVKSIFTVCAHLLFKPTSQSNQSICDFWFHFPHWIPSFCYCVVSFFLVSPFLSKEEGDDSEFHSCLTSNSTLRLMELIRM